ncbi:hypothetical protein M0802_012597 [Mischocyttarus mexicanus]|nr:hypothetical protein M0802_012597 [Mischocyttarus mexicanus]
MRNLPKHWVKVKSKTHIDRVYYFNTKTNESSWKEPTEDDTNMAPSKETRNVKKRKINVENPNKSRRTPELEDEEDNNKSNLRQRLVAKRNFKPVQNVDTLQMIDIRKKIEIRRNKNNNKSNSSTNSVKTDNSNTTSSRNKKIVTPEPTTSKFDKPETMTPQMRVIYEKLEKKRMEKKGSKSSRSVSLTKDIDVVDKVQSTIKENKNRVSTRNTKVSTAKPSTSNQSMNHISNDFGHNFTENVSRNLIKNSTNKKSLKESSDMDNTMPIKKFKPGLTKTGNKVSNNVIFKRSKSDSFKTNLGKDRMEKLRESLNVQVKTQDNFEFLDIHKTSDTRHKYLRNRLLHNKTAPNEEELLKSVQFNILDKSYNKSCENLTNESSSTYEEMDWEPLEDEEITFEVQAARIKLCTRDKTDKILPIEGSILQFPSQEVKKIMYIVVDTNVFLSNLNAVIDTINTKFKTYNRPIIVVPWTVIRELDYLKVARSKKNLHEKARKAIQFLNNSFSNKDPHVVGQTLQDVMNNKEKFAAECPDDEILQVCLQIRDAGRDVALLSYDKNLCNKAMISDILALGRNDPLEKIDYMFSTKNKTLNYHDISVPKMQGEGSQMVSAFQEELCYSNDLYTEVESVMKEALSVVVSKEMRKLYDKMWENCVIIKPPWTVSCVLQCAIKHWIAATSEAFDKEAYNLLKELLELFKTMTEGSRTLKDVLYLLEKCSDLIQSMNIDEYSDLMTRALNAIQDLQQKCYSYKKETSVKKLLEMIGKEDDEIEQECRAQLAFKYFDQIYTYARDYGGIAAQILKMPTSFFFQTPDPVPTPDHVIEIQPELSRNVHHLLRALTNAVEEMNDCCVEHKTLINLYEILNNFFPEDKFRHKLTPLDIYYCLKSKEELLKQGIKQLQELSTHYSKLTNCIYT